MTEEEFIIEWADAVGVMLMPWQVDMLIELIRKQPKWVVVGRDPMLGMMPEAPPVHTWRLN